MIKNYLLIIWRNFYRQPTFTVLNLSGLTVGIAATLIILLYIDFEFNFDRFHENASDIYRVEADKINTHNKTMDVDWVSASNNLAYYLKQDYPEIKEVVRFYEFHQNERIRFQYQGQEFEEAEVVTTDSSLFDVFSYQLLGGNPQEALRGPNKIVLSQRLAERIFEDEEPVGKTLETKLVHAITGLEEDYNLVVSGVFANTPRNTHLYAQAFISAETDPYLLEYYFKRFQTLTYVQLNPSANPTELAPKLTAIYDTYLDPQIEPVLKSIDHELVPLTKIHFEETGGLTYLYIFSAIGFLILLIAGISYVNLVTAQGSKRAQEIGIRKVLGSNRKQLIFQFLMESFCLSLLALFLAISLLNIGIPYINATLDLYLESSQLWQPQVILGLLGILFLLGILGGSYPAFILSAFKPITTLKGKLVKSTPVRKALVGIQFAVVIFVLVCTGMIYDQLNFIRNKDLGFRQEQVVRLTLSGAENMEQGPLLKELLLSDPNILKTSTSSFTPGLFGMARRPVSAKGTAGEEPQLCWSGNIDYDYLNTYEIELLKGRNFSSEFPGDRENSVLVNEAFVQNFGLEAPLLGAEVRWGDKGNPNFFTVIGVVKDFHQSSLHSPIESQVFRFRPESNLLSVQLGKDIQAGINHIEKTWASVFPNQPFEYQFLDDLFQQRYEADQRRGQIFFAFSILTIFIAFLGLFGLASYLAKQRTKEIGIRKVFGAPVWNLVLLLSKNFLVLVLVVALPTFVIAWYVVQQWLDNFAFQVELNYLIFAVALLFTLILTFLTTSFHAIQVSSLNPAKTLRYE